MSKKIARRDFLKAAPAAAVLAYSTKGSHIIGSAPDTGNLTTEQAAASPPAQARSKPSDVRIGSARYTPVEDYPIQPKIFSEVKLTDTFWKPKVATNATVTIPFEVKKFAESGYGRGLNGGVLEAAILSLRTHPDAQLQAQVDTRIRAMAQGDGAAGGGRTGNGGFEIAATWFKVTGKRDLLDNAIRSAATLYEDFQLRNPPFSGGERDAMNCVQLYRVTHDKKHLDLAKHYLDIRGLENSVNRSRHNQSYKPVLEQREAVGHAVNCVTLMTSLADVGVLTGIRAYLDAAQHMWRDAAERKMYVTGGVGSSGNEGFAEPYWLPNTSAYAETCAVLMFMTLNHRLFMATGDSKYIDVMERGMYNNAICGGAAAGNRFFYVNRLASAGDGRDERWENASLECCPPNLVRFLAGMPGLIYANDKRGSLYVNLYVSSETSFEVDKKTLALAVQSEMPWGGKSNIRISSAEPVRAALRLRIPSWTRNQPAPGDLYSYVSRSDAAVTASLNGKRVAAVPDKSGYLSIDRVWTSGDVVEIEFPMEARRVAAHQKVRDCQRKVAIERGPIVYCAEWPEVADKRAMGLLLDPKAPLQSESDPGFFGGVTAIRTSARSVNNPDSPARQIKLVPYHLWANRGAGEMSVWLSTAEYAIGDIGPAEGFIFCINPNYAQDGWRYLEAAPFDQSSGTKWGCFRRLIPGARGTAIGTGKQNTIDMMAACTERGSAADLCANLNLNGFGGWFLPSRDELALMYKNLRATQLADFGDTGKIDNFTYWASSQQTADMAAHIDFADLGRLHGDDKDFPRRVRAIRMI